MYSLALTKRRNNAKKELKIARKELKILDPSIKVFVKYPTKLIVGKGLEKYYRDHRGY